MLEVLAEFAVELRRLGMPVSPDDVVAAAGALAVVGLGSKEVVRSALSATLLKSFAHKSIFDQAFDIYFSLISSRTLASTPFEDTDSTGFQDMAEYIALSRVDPSQMQTQLGRTAHLLDHRHISDLVEMAIMRGDSVSVAQAARKAVALYAGLDGTRQVGMRYHVLRAIRGIEMDAILTRLIAAALKAGRDLKDGLPNGELSYNISGNYQAAIAQPGKQMILELAGLGATGERLIEDEYKRRAKALTKAIEQEVIRQLVAANGASSVAKSTIGPLIENIELTRASAEDLVLLRRALVPLARVLATRLARKRRSTQPGMLDFRATIRKSLANGGVPLQLVNRHRHPSKPEIVVLADISGSVASFARFTLHLVHAIAGQFQKVRTFVFVDGLDEVTSALSKRRNLFDAVEKVMETADVISDAGHSDYGAAFEAFMERYGKVVTKRTIVIVLGDARGNYHLAKPEILKQLKARSKGVHWLNPEPRRYWDSGDSVIGLYAPHCDSVVECRTLSHLEQFVDRLR